MPPVYTRGPSFLPRVRAWRNALTPSRALPVRLPRIAALYLLRLPLCAYNAGRCAPQHARGTLVLCHNLHTRAYGVACRKRPLRRAAALLTRLAPAAPWRVLRATAAATLPYALPQRRHAHTHAAPRTPYTCRAALPLPRQRTHYALAAFYAMHRITALPAFACRAAPICPGSYPYMPDMLPACRRSRVLPYCSPLRATRLAVATALFHTDNGNAYLVWRHHLCFYRAYFTALVLK